MIHSMIVNSLGKIEEIWKRNRFCNHNTHQRYEGVDGLGLNDVLGEVVPVFYCVGEEGCLLVLSTAMREGELLVVAPSLASGEWFGAWP
jgi:hypothetical protein